MKRCPVAVHYSAWGPDMPFTLVLTRQPDNLFQYHTGRKDDPSRMIFAIETGRFGTLVVFKGAKVTSVELLKGNQQGAGSVEVPGGRLEIVSDGGVTEVGRFTTIERFDHNMVSLHRQAAPYDILYETNNKKVAELGPTHGNCFRVRGGHTEAQRGILIHAAPHVGWLTGCISPRKLGDSALQTESTYRAIIDLYKLIGSEHADLYVTDS
jgi:hypothetical protein